MWPFFKVHVLIIMKVRSGFILRKYYHMYFTSDVQVWLRTHNSAKGQKCIRKYCYRFTYNSNLEFEIGELVLTVLYYDKII